MSAEVRALRVERESRVHNHAMAFVTKRRPVRFEQMVHKPMVLFRTSLVISERQPAVVRAIRHPVAVRRTGDREARELTQREVLFKKTVWHPGSAFGTQEVFHIIGEV